MAALGAGRSGASLVTVAADKNIPALHSHLPEAMALTLMINNYLVAVAEGCCCLGWPWTSG